MLKFDLTINLTFKAHFSPNNILKKTAMTDYENFLTF